MRPLLSFVIKFYRKSLEIRIYLIALAPVHYILPFLSAAKPRGGHFPIDRDIFTEICPLYGRAYTKVAPAFRRKAAYVVVRPKQGAF